MKIEQRTYIDVTEAVAVRKAEPFSAELLAHAIDSCSCLCAISGLDERHVPILFTIAADDAGLRSVAETDGKIVVSQLVIDEIVLYDLALIAEAQHEILEPVMGIDLHYVPQHRPPADLDHRFRRDLGLFAEAGSLPAA